MKRTTFYKLQYITHGPNAVLKITPNGATAWIELRGKSNFEIAYDPNDKLHRTVTQIGKGVNVSDFVNGKIVTVFDRGDATAEKARRVLDAIVAQ